MQEAEIRQQLLDVLSQLTPGQQRSFKLVYGQDDGRRSTLEAQALHADVIVAEIPVGYLSMALHHATSTYERLSDAPEHVSQPRASGRYVSAVAAGGGH